MVRAHVKQPSEEVKEVNKKKPSSTKRKPRAQETGVWFCKINGCNKEFAREADLKRHQRTTKVHSTPGMAVSCPQCDAFFSRTDALRRHQKSRHNGVIIEPQDSGRVIQQRNLNEQNLGDLVMRSRPVTMNEKGNSRASIGLDTSVQTTGSFVQSYYRHHTMESESVPFQSGTHMPTSATRWAPPTTWDSSDAQHSTPTSTFSAATNKTPYYRNVYYKNEDGRPILSPGSIAQQQLQIVSNTSIGELKTSHSPNFYTPSNFTIGIDTKFQISETKDTIASHNPSVDEITEAEFGDTASLNEAVQMALDAVLAIDPSLHSSLSSPDQSHIVLNDSPQSILNSQHSSLHSSNGSTSDTSPEHVSFSRSGSAAHNDNSLHIHNKAQMKGSFLMADECSGIDIDADGEADIADSEYITEGDARTYETYDNILVEDNMTMLRPDELLNEVGSPF